MPRRSHLFGDAKGRDPHISVFGELVYHARFAEHKVDAPNADVESPSSFYSAANAIDAEAGQIRSGNRREWVGGSLHAMSVDQYLYPDLVRVHRAFVDLMVLTGALAKALGRALCTRKYPTFEYEGPPQFRWPAISNGEFLEIWERRRAYVPEALPIVWVLDEFHRAHFLWRQSIAFAREVVDVAHSDLQEAGRMSMELAPVNLHAELANLTRTPPRGALSWDDPREYPDSLVVTLESAKDRLEFLKDKLGDAARPLKRSVAVAAVSRHLEGLIPELVSEHSAMPDPKGTDAEVRAVTERSASQPYAENAVESIPTSIDVEANVPDPRDAAVLRFLNLTPGLRRYVSDIQPDYGPQDRKSIGQRLRRLADRNPPLVDFPEGGRTGAAILPAGIEALNRLTPTTPH